MRLFISVTPINFKSTSSNGEKDTLLGTQTRYYLNQQKSESVKVNRINCSKCERSDTIHIVFLFIRILQFETKKINFQLKYYTPRSLMFFYQTNVVLLERTN